MRQILLSCLCLCLCTGQVCAEEIKSVKTFGILYSRTGAGMFSVFTDVMMLLNAYENGKYAGVSVDFGKTGVYYDANHGPNWWEYYCETICLGNTDAKKQSVAYGGVLYVSHQDCQRLLKEHIHFKPHIQKKIDDFISENFKSPLIIGVHYRGTDKHIETPRIPYETVIQKLKEAVKYFNVEDYQIFIATDEIAFIDRMEEQFPEKIIYCTDVLRSEDEKKPVHLNSENPYKRGEEALIDCVLLSKCNLLYRTHSNLSQWSSIFNPAMPVHVFWPK